MRSLDTFSFSIKKKSIPLHWLLKESAEGTEIVLILYHLPAQGLNHPLRTKSVIHNVQKGSFKGGHEIAQLLIYPEILYSGNKYSMLPSALEDFLHKEGTTRLNTKNNCD